MSDFKIKIEEIKDLMDKMAQTGLGKVAIEDGDFKLTLAAKSDKIVMTQSEATPAMPATANTPVAKETAPADTSAPVIAGNVVTAPIVGTFYDAPSPDKAPFVQIGQRVKKGDVLFIIESMKLMNEVQSELDGEVVDICVETGAAVEYDQAVMIIR